MMLFIKKIKFEIINNSSIIWRNYFLFVEIIIVIIVEKGQEQQMKLEFLHSNSKEIHIDLRKEILKGNILDVGMDNYGIIYNLYKLYNKEASLEYIQGREEKELIEKASYDSCILLFSLNSLWLKSNKKSLFKDIYDYLHQDGLIYIWDIDKSYSRVFNGKVKVLLPENNVKDISLTNMNVFKDSSAESTLKLLKQHFEIIDFQCYDNVYYIKAKKKLKSAADAVEAQTDAKGSSEDENSVSGNKFKVRTQQFSNKILEGMHRRFKL
jgi:hypothetical protein